MGITLHFGGVEAAVQIEGLGFFGKYNRYAEILRCDTCDADTGGFDGEDLGDGFICKEAFEFFTNFIDKCDVHLMIQKAVYFQYMSRPDLAVLQNLFLQCFHVSSS